MKKIISALGITLLALLFAACVPKVSGDVVDKSYHEAHYVTDMVPQYTQQCSTVYDSASGSSRQSCSQRLSHYLPVQRYVPDRWKIQVLDDESQKKHWITVNEGVYDSLDIGDFFTNEEEK